MHESRSPHLPPRSQSLRKPPFSPLPSWNLSAALPGTRRRISQTCHRQTGNAVLQAPLSAPSSLPDIHYKPPPEAPKRLRLSYLSPHPPESAWTSYHRSVDPFGFPSILFSVHWSAHTEVCQGNHPLLLPASSDTN